MTRKIAHVCAAKGLGGLELYSIHLHQKFKQHGFEGIHYTLEQSKLDQKLKSMNLPVISIPQSGYLSWERIKQFRKSIREEGIKQIIVHHLKDLWFVTPALWGMNDVEVIGVSHMFIKNINKKDPLHWYLYRRLKKLISLTEVQKKALLKCLPVKDEQIAVIPNGIDLSQFKSFNPEKRQELRDLISVSKDEILIGLVGRIEPLKGQLELLQAFSSLNLKNKKLKLCFIGDLNKEKHSEYMESLKKIIESKKLDKFVSILSFQNNIANWMHAFDVFVMPSHEETFGIVLIEAMAAGLPCISTRAGGVPDIIHSKELGSLVAPKSALELERALELIVADPDRRQRIGMASREHAFKNYDLEKIFMRIKNLFDGLKTTSSV